MDCFEAQDRFDSEYDVDSRARRLRHGRLVARLGRQAGCPDFVAAGTKIVGLNRSSFHFTTVNFIFDAATRMVSATPPFRSPKKSATFWTVGGTVYALDLVADESQHAKERCLFERLGPEPRTGGHVTARAVHPDGATVFLSFYETGTFSFNGERLEWTRHGGWDLPFDGEAFYVRDLGAWVDLCSRHRGRLAACRVVGGRRGGAEPDGKCGRDLLFRQKWRRHIEANLVYMGDTKFCLLETLTTEEEKDRSDIYGLIVPMLLRVVTFRVQYSWDGELCVVDRRSRVYNLPWYSSGHKPQAFWI
ncbi:hypothetical protein C2845_PM04G27100 [Panicum miliaceum]|uniref:DUF295 domain-containing protein n=1 Tax=Panicum miliaceum TaxID=4540 RepID=A0A3L6QKP7_PANMI|nr:hypothetical protein C2845_PM04G27100 [Panicum miliaceum]